MSSLLLKANSVDIGINVEGVRALFVQFDNNPVIAFLSDSPDGLKIEVLGILGGTLSEDAVGDEVLHIIEPMAFLVRSQLLEHALLADILVNKLFGRDLFGFIGFELLKVRGHDGAVLATVYAVVVDMDE